MSEFEKLVYELDKELERDIESLNEYADENLEISRGADYDLMLTNLYDGHYEKYLALCEEFGEV